MVQGVLGNRIKWSSDLDICPSKINLLNSKVGSDEMFKGWF